MKNEFNFFPTHKINYQASSNERLVLELDVNIQSDIIGEIKFSGELRDKFENMTNVLELHIKNIRPQNVLSTISSLGLQLSLPIILLNNFLEDFQGIQIEKNKKDFICNCFGISKFEIVNLLQSKKLMELKELNSLTSVGLGCGSCVGLLRTIYLDFANEHYSENSLNSNLSESGGFVKINNQTPAEFLLLVAKIKSEIFTDDFIIQGMNGVHFTIKNLNSFQKEKVIELQTLVLKRTGVLVFFQ